LLGPGQQPHHCPSQEQESKESTNLGMQKLQFWKFESQHLNISNPVKVIKNVAEVYPFNVLWKNINKVRERGSGKR